MKRIIVGLTGASGSIFFKRLIEELINQKHEIYVIATEYGEKVFQYEIDLSFIEYINNLKYKHIYLCDKNNMFHKVASGSFKTDGMIIIPCSMGTIGKIANGTSDNLLIRAADVCIKEHKKLIIAFREAPLSTIHLNNLLTLANSGSIIFPTVPAFYAKPSNLDDMIDQIIGRILSYFDIDTSLNKEWNGV